MSKGGNPYARALQAAIKTDPTKEIAGYQWCLRQVLEHSDAVRKALHAELGDRRLSRDEWKDLLEARMIAALLPLARGVKPSRT